MTVKIKRTVKKPSVWLYPTAIERDYVYALDSLTDDLLAEVSQFCNQQEKFYRLHQDGIFDWLERVFNELLTSMMFHVSPHKVQKMVRKSLDETNQFNKKQFHKMLKKAYGVDIFTAENGLSDKLKLFELQNINLIKSIPTQLHEKLRYKFVEAVQKGKRWETLVDEVQELGQVTRNRAKLIARDQIGKLNGQLTQIRQEEIGVKQYIWRTSLDERVRKLHVHREGETFDWANPPDDGHPGEPIRCRCYAEAVLPTLDELVAQKQAVAMGDDAVKVEEKPISTKTGKMSLSELIDNSIGRGGNKLYSDIGSIHPELATKAKESIGLDILDWKHSVDESGIRHTFKQHGNETTESKRGQRAVTKKDILLLPTIISSFDSIEYAGLSDMGNETFLIRKEIEDEIFTVQEVRKKHKKLTMKTMWIRKKSKKEP